MFRGQAIRRLVKVCCADAYAQVPGIGPITASALVASIGDAKNFDNGRQVPKVTAKVRMYGCNLYLLTVMN
jgi:transposase